jgi:cyclic beta-1,2-glucan synthetase
VAVNLVNWIVTQTVPPRMLPKIDFRDGIPADRRTMVVVPSLLSRPNEVDFLLQQLERHYLGNADPHLGFALLTDFADAPEEEMPEDAELLAQARRGIENLNQKYGGEEHRPFYLFHRKRLWNPCEKVWMGWERKRGKLAEFNRLLRGGQETSFVEQVGDLELLPEVKYVITLDADTILPRESAHRLVGTMVHPLNRPEFDPDTGTVVAGYTVLQPRVEIKPTAANQSIFSRIFSRDVGLDLYTRAVSDVYQDLFGEGSYVGKGIYDIDAFERSLTGRMPENALLSHDLFEGIHGRAGLVTDVVLYEDYPPGYLTYAHRLHRWVRGDWQLLPWLWPRVPSTDGGRVPTRLSILDRWKILDNLRRSLHAPTLMALLILGWLWLPGSPWFWTLVTLFASVTPLITAATAALVQRLRDPESRGIAPTLRLEASRWLLSLVFLPYEATIIGDAIVTTLWRLTVSRKRLLQWTTAAHTVRLLGRERKVRVVWNQMRAGPLLTLGLALLIALVKRGALLPAVPLLLIWLVSPQVALWISRTTARKPASLSSDRQQQLRRLARRTWLYFERFVGPEDRWLPPDHFQEDPRGLVAHRTSPTNISLLLLSTLSAYELGYLGLMGLTLRLRNTLESMEQLERYRGHFLNWYDTRRLAPLSPRYVSTVDSGNLASGLVALKQGLAAQSRRPILRWARWQGLLDALDILAEIMAGIEDRHLQEAVASLTDHLNRTHQRILDVQDAPRRWASLLADLNANGWERYNELLMNLIEVGSGALGTTRLANLRRWSERLEHHLKDMQDELDLLLPWLPRLDAPPALLTQGSESKIAGAWGAFRESLSLTASLQEIPSVCHKARQKLDRLQALLQEKKEATDRQDAQQALDWCDGLEEDLAECHRTANRLLVGLQNLQEQAERYFQEAQFDFLYDKQRRVFFLGYQVEAEKLDANHYDLLASEARIASLVAIAKGDVPQSHWLHLGRPLTQIDGLRALLSWNGSMFEYLMPTLFMHRYDETLLSQTDRAVVRRQIDYAREEGVPWGVSESGYYRFDANLNYQYQGFGVPGLGRKRGLDEDLVISPYASLLALSVSPQEVVENVDDLIQAGMLGPFGFYEAIDFTASRLPLGQRGAIVKSYMVHHQGMILLSLTNYLRQEAIADHFHADPRVQSAELLLQEQVPQGSPVESVPEETPGMMRQEESSVALEPWTEPIDAPQPRLHHLSNGRFSTLVTSAGGGYSSYTPRRAGQERAVALTRWRADATQDDWGIWIYVQDQESGRLWSAGHQPIGARPQDGEVRFYAHQAEFRRRDDGISLHLEITVDPNEPAEIRRITLTNHGDRPRRLRLVSYGEVVLAPQATDRRHPAFNKLFVESEYLPESNALLFRRRPRSGEESPLCAAHLLSVEGEVVISGAHETDRARFLGRGRTASSPQALKGDRQLSGTTGATLDPIMALAQEIELPPHGAARLAYVTLAAESRAEAVSLAEQYHDWGQIVRAFRQARAQSEVELRNLDLEAAELAQIQRLLSALLYPSAPMRAAPQTLAANRLGQPGLWSFAISGDYPILLVRIGSPEEISLVREALQAHRYWRQRQIKIDLVILNLQDVGYAQELHEQLMQLIGNTDSDAWLNRRGGIFVLRANQMSDDAQLLLETAARAILDSRQGSLDQQLEKMDRRPTRLPQFVPALPAPKDLEPTPPPERPTDLQFDNGWGGFSADGREYVIYLRDDEWTPAPWINVIANSEFGFLTSEAGLGYTWAENSGENRLTPWRNDPVSDTPGEALYLRDEETARVWSPTPLPAREEGPYLIRHGAGYTTYQHHSHGLKQRLRLFAAPDAPVKILHLELENTWDRPRRITATYYVEWVLGVHRDDGQQYVVPQYDADRHALLARNAYHTEFGERVAFVAVGQDLHGLTADRIEFLGRHGRYRHPAALDRVGLSGSVRPGQDPCAALQIHLDLAPHESKTVHFILGQGADRRQANDLIDRYHDPSQVQAAWESLTAFWDELLGTVTVHTPDAAMNLLLNRWLLYQALACRVWGRSALYQSGGAFGYRDQLQDVMSLLHAAPHLAREHLLRAAEHQFEAGDVLHWWHPPSGRGVRTRITDDLLWLPYVAAEYVATTGDAAILEEKVPFRKAEPLEPGEEERYGHYETTDEAFTLYEHCCRAIERGTTSGPHDLPLMGAGDWNDGMNRVGIEGRGESVWLGWFLYAVLTRFARLCERMEDAGRAETYRRRAKELQEALEANAWDGEWYRRAYSDDGAPLGSAESLECQIDSLAQSWAVLSGAGKPERLERAMQSVLDRLVRKDDGLLLLFTPPFDETPRDPGYIKGYPPGIRENGGQYTHAALWAIWATAQRGEGDRANALFWMINPVYHANTREKARRYRVEPYVVAADVYSAPPHTGRGGWTWYTGSSGWMYRLGVEALLGLHKEGSTLRIDPRIPAEWAGYRLTYRHRDTVYEIEVENPEGVDGGVKQVTLAGEIVEEGRVPLADDGGLHRVRVLMG